MTVMQYSVTWDSFNSNICHGFARLQQQEEFVDMTLAAEGHLVKVHQNIIALASPFLKELLQSIPCRHPVIFLNNITHKVLCYLLEYIYNGEVMVPQNMLTEFLNSAKSLHLSGVDSCNLPKTKDDPVIEQPIRPTNIAAHITINSDNFNIDVEKFPNNVPQIDMESTTGPQDKAQCVNIAENQNFSIHIDNFNNTIEGDFTALDTIDLSVNETNAVVEQHSLTDIDMGDIDSLQNNENGLIDNCKSLDQIEDLINLESNIQIHKVSKADGVKAIEMPITAVLSNENNSNKTLPINVNYTISNRGCLQLILNRYMYYCHHQSHGGLKRRWRCVDYRKKHCPAYIDTEGEVLVKRNGAHSHTFHDGKIMKKSKKCHFFTSLVSAEEKAIMRTSKNTSNKSIVIDCDE